MAEFPLELMAKARAGEAEALGELCALYRNYLRKVVQTGLGTRLRGHVDLSDVVQEALIEVVRQFPRFTGKSEMALLGWLRHLVGQKLADLGRHYNRAKRSPAGACVRLDAGADDGGGRLIDILSLSQSSPSELAGRRELVVLLGRAMADLPDLDAKVLRLYHAEGLSFEAIGERLGLTRKSARGIWARGLKTVKRTLDGDPGGTLRHRDGVTA